MDSNGNTKWKYKLR